MDKNLKTETLLQHLGENRLNHQGAVVPPLFQNSLFTFENWQAIDAAFDDRVNSCIYSRGNNPTVNLAEEKIASLAGGEQARLFGSGMAAISAAVLHFVNPGDHIITIKNMYGPASNLLNVYLRKKMHIDVTYVSGESVRDFEQAVTDKTQLIYLESPSSAVFSLQDIAAVARFSRQRGIKTIIDNTWATPIFQQPLAMGIDLEVHSCSKYFGGHSDLVAGVVIGSAQDLAEIAVNEYELLGGKMAPFEAWLVLRSLRTMPVRMRQHQQNAMLVAKFLQGHAAVQKVNYPGLPEFPQYELGKKQMQGYSGLLSFALASENLQQIQAFFNSLQIFQIGVSWGGHESLIYAPAISYLKELPPQQFAAMGISMGDMRLSVGLENAEDLIADLAQALEHITG